MKTKNQKISESMSLTRHKRNNQICFVREFKIKYSACNKSQKEYLKRIMLEAKWFFNYFLAWTKSNPETAISEFNSKINTITKKDTCNKISQEEIDRFNNYLNVIVKSNKSSNNLNNRISSIYELVKNHYKDYQKLNSIMVSNNNN